MSEMAPEQGGTPGGGGGNLLTGKFLGIPGIVWLLGAAAIAYFLFTRSQGGSGGASTTGGGGTIDQSGNTTTVDKGAVTISVSQGSGNTSTDNNTQPKPKPPPRKKTGKMVKVPNVAGKRAAFGISDIESLGLEVIQTNPLRDPKHEYVVTGSTPAAGSMVPEGTKIRLNVRKIR